MGALREQMKEELTLRRYAPDTVAHYLGCAKRLAAHYGRSPAELGAEEVRAFVLHLVKERRVHPATHLMYVAALHFLYRETLKRPEVTPMRIAASATSWACSRARTRREGELETRRSRGQVSRALGRDVADLVAKPEATDKRSLRASRKRSSSWMSRT